MDGKHETILGVDEAGYGPRLGPLVVGISVFRVPAGAPGLKKLLPVTSERNGPLPVADSKLVYRGGRGLAALERSVLAFRSLAASADLPDASRGRHPWSRLDPAEIPVAAAPAEVAESEAALRAALDESGVEVLALATRTVPVGEFNREVERRGNKARLLFDAAMDLAAPWLFGEGVTRVIVDRHGGRKFYSEPFTERFPDRFHWVITETPERSAYRFPHPGGETTVSFEVEADRNHLAPALASMAAKYVRELSMRTFNAHFTGADPDLRPTAGYYEDAGRWLSESAPVREQLGVPEELLVRKR